MQRRQFLVASGLGFAGMTFGSPTPAVSAAPAPTTSGRKPAKSTILFFLCGGASHMDMWDMKP
ncbi:MAG: twin-arginine translocation signal domain-containing protein, partial [Gimesia chilikensis]